MLSDDLTRWFDDELWRVADGSSGTRFASALRPDELLVDAPAAIWPALMPCDFLPILGNNMGDWLCVRMADDNSAQEVVHWYHGGGDWIPWGATLAEAVFFDHVRRRLPGGRRDHAISAGDDTDEKEQATRRLNEWALERLERRSIRQLEPLSGNDLAAAMLENQISEPAVLCQLIIDALDNPILSDERVRSSQLDDADQIQRSLFDNRLMNAELVAGAATERLSSDQVLSLQDWDAVEAHCRRVTEVAPELAWGWDLLGYSLERSGDIVGAQTYYRKGLHCSIFTDQTVRVRTHGFNGDGQKFSAARLMELGYAPSEPDEREYFKHLCVSSADDRRDQVREHFSLRATQADAAEAHDLWKRAGWDLGAEPMIAFAELLEQVSESADAAGRTAESALAKTHRACFRERYRI